ncbi:DUF3261 domain-containing protein [Shewanella sp. Choline-02u-19]|jgi:hypothetical protein|uniref:DUF3261 domain-containing protein n=1 Tax=unclassified Shewanella TaxID=196818 RepID=UPI000C349BEC|nr:MULTISPECIES: DUF3261 domain-containing protein [unclassified Shewanella]PKG55488.1 DUF3261 domain-containing protein [Shewanella sp. GutDb-MelDb]PKH60061.1 DUF3261 domain-containing protein [Shewanella sp. Bg11-22]PKI29219.1 DUF3261 domain-containing protein [Shewanella sp. Choline-02u-19]
MSQLTHFLKGISCFSLLLLAGCSQTLQRQTCVELPSNVSYCLAPLNDASTIEPSKPFTERSLTQKTTIKTQSSQHELLTQLELNPQQLTLVGLAPLGQPLFTLTYDGDKLISEQSTLLGNQFKAEYLLAIMQLVYWREDSLNRHLQNGYIQGYNCDGAYCRKLFAAVPRGSSKEMKINAEDPQPIVTIRYSRPEPWQAKVELRIDAADFELIITPL